MRDNGSLVPASDLLGPRVRLIRGERGVTRAASAEDTGVSSSTGDGPADVARIVGRQGDRMDVRARCERQEPSG